MLLFCYMKHVDNWGIIGHKNIIDSLKISIANDRLAHAYIFHGPAHIGKTTLAEKFIFSLLSFDDKKQLLSHEQIFRDNLHPDIYFVRREKDEKTDQLNQNISIDQIRELRKKLSLGTLLNSYKIAVIEEAESMSIQAANGFLKTLEEPTKKTIIILLSKEAELLPKTIASRCQIFKLLPVAKNDIFDYLIAKGAARTVAKNLSALSLGLPGLAMDFFQNQELLEDYKEQTKIFIKMCRGDVNKKFKRIAGFFVSKLEPEEVKKQLDDFLKTGISIFRDVLLIKNEAPELIANTFLESELKDLAGQYNALGVNSLLGNVSKARHFLKMNVNPRLIMENLALRF